MASAAQPNDGTVPVYLSFATFKSAVQNLRTHGLPAKIDKTAWHSRSGADQSQILSAFKFLGLIDSEDNTQEILRKLVAAKEGTADEKGVLENILRTRYGKVFDLDLKAATPAALEEKIGAYGTTGATRDRAVRFFVRAALYCGIVLSGRLTANIRERAPANAEAAEGAESPAPSIQKQRKRRRAAAPAIANAPTPSDGTAMKTVLLPKVGGSLTISGTFNAFALVGSERDLVYKIIDMMNEFEQNTETASK